MAKGTGESIERRQIVMLVALGVVLIGLIYFAFLRGGSSPETPQAPARDPLAQSQSSQDPFEEETDEANKAPLETYEVFASRDPFEPVVESGSASESEAGQGENPGGNAGGNAGQGEGATGPAQANNEEVQGHTVTLVDVFREDGEDMAQVEVDATGYPVAVGEVFAENFQLVSTSGDCATLLYGDDQFTLCEGEQILK
jgi:hypothetical protein